MLPEPSVGQEIAACLRPLVNHLPDKYKQAIVLTEFNGLTQKELGGSGWAYPYPGLSRGYSGADKN